jgi:hypothetical protein
MSLFQCQILFLFCMDFIMKHLCDLLQGYGGRDIGKLGHLQSSSTVLSRMLGRGFSILMG